MFRFIFPILFLTSVAAEPAKRTPAPAPPEGFPKFEVEEIDTGLKIGYAVIVVDVDGDKKPDIVVVDQLQVVWYQNPTWKKRVILDGKTKPDNVCITAMDIDGDGLPEFVVGAGWKPFDTKTPGTLQWLKRGKTLDEEWSMHPIPCDEPTVHRIRAIDIDGDGKPELINVPLMGREATKEKNWMDGRPVRIMAYKIPASDPEKPKNWKAEVLNEALHVTHNFDAVYGNDTKLFVASYEGLHRLSRDKQGKWSEFQIGKGDQSTPKGSLGSSEVALGRKTIENGVFKSGGKVKSVWLAEINAVIAATIEPWHGNSVVIYTQTSEDSNWSRKVVDSDLRWGHAVKFANLRKSIADDKPIVDDHPSQDRLGFDDLIVGVRDNPTKDDKFTEKRGVRIYHYNPKTEKWERYILEDGGVAVEDLTVADLDGDGKPDIVAVGRATGNARIYWNKGK